MNKYETPWFINKMRLLINNLIYQEVCAVNLFLLK